MNNEHSAAATGIISGNNVLSAMTLVLDHVPVVIFATEAGDDTVLFANREFVNRFGNNSVGRKIGEFLPVDLAKSEQDEDSHDVYCDRTSEWFAVSSSDIALKQGGCVRLHTARVVTARKLLAEVKKSADAVRDGFLEEARAEIGVPLKAIGGIADQIMMEYITPQVRNHAFRIKHAASTLLVAVNDFINVKKNAGLAGGDTQRAADPLAGIKGLDVALGRENMSNSEKLYRQILAQYCTVSPSMRAQIMKSLGNRDLQNLVIHLHSLKSSTASIGAVALSYRAARLEHAGREADWGTLEGDIGDFLDDWQTLVGNIWQALGRVEEDGAAQKIGDSGLLAEELEKLKSMLVDFDPNGAEKILDSLKQHQWSEPVMQELDAISGDILLSDFDQAIERADALMRP